MRKVIDAIKRAGVAAKDAQTSTVSLSPRYSGNGEDIVGFTATNLVNATIRGVSRSGAVIDAAVNAVRTRSTARRSRVPTKPSSTGARSLLLSRMRVGRHRRSPVRRRCGWAACARSSSRRPARCLSPRRRLLQTPERPSSLGRSASRPRSQWNSLFASQRRALRVRTPRTQGGPRGPPGPFRLRVTRRRRRPQPGLPLRPGRAWRCRNRDRAVRR